MAGKASPAVVGNVVATLVLALMLSLAPLPAWLAPYAPDWVLMTLIYWAIYRPTVCGVGVAWLAGLVVDVTFGTLLAQHALAAAFVIYLTAKFHLQLRAFPFWQLTATVLGLLAIYRFILLWVNGVAGITVPAVDYWAPIVTGAILWPFLAAVLPPLVDSARSRT